MALRVRLDPSIDAYIMETENVTLHTLDDIRRWRLDLDIEFSFREKKPILIDIVGMNVAPQMREAYGKNAKEFAEKYSLGIFRYGDAEGMTVSALRLAAVEQNYHSNIYANIEAAKEALSLARLKASTTTHASPKK